MSVAGWYHCSVKTMGRSAGRSVVAAAAYRLGERLHETETLLTHDYRRRHGVTASFTLAPADAPAWASDPERLWNAASAAEKRKNSTLAREIELALPSAVTPEARAGIARAMAQELVDRYGVAVTVAIHAPSQAGDQRNHHAHLLFTTRRLGPDGFTGKTRMLDDRKTGPEEVTHLRAHAAALINAALADAGSDERVDHRSFALRGIAQAPTEHLGPAASAKQRRREASERGATNNAITTSNHQLDGLVEELAALDAEIAAAEEQALDARFGTADEGASDHQPDGGPSAAPDAFATVHRETIAQIPPADPGLSMFLPEKPAAPAPDIFAAVHDRTISQATADLAVIQTEEASGIGPRFQRIRAWWGNLLQQVTEWREHFEARVEGYWGRRERQPDRDEIEP